MSYQIIQGDNRETLKTLADNSVDAIVTDPPYGIGFLGKDWDSKKASETTSKMVAMQNLPSGMKHTSLADDLEFQYWMRDLWIECYRVLKPGGYVLSFSAARTYHHMAMSLQTAGFEIRDQIMWIYSSGFPKSQDVGKNNDMPDWTGWGTALKPAHEPIALARKPTKLSFAKNVEKWGGGALNIDAARIPVEGSDTRSGGSNGHSRLTFGEGITSNADSFVGYTPDEQGRFPSNVIGEIPDYQKYFYCPKVSRRERHIGYDLTDIPTNPDGMMSRDENGQLVNNYTAKKADAGTNHPTV
jgi:site-specific DNA-methyltransferase (adenine-specific)